LAATSAFAQSSVTLYGIAEAGFGTSNTTGKAAAADNVKTAGLVNGTGNGRWGIKGTEDIGNGLKANFVAEAQLLIADGTTFDQTAKNQVANSQQTNVFGAKTRQTLVGLQNNLGALNLGYKKGVEQDHNDTFNLGFQEAAAGNEFHTAARLGRAKGIWYTSPAFGGVTVNVQQSSGSAEYSDAATQAAKQIDVAITGLSALYVNGPLTAGVSYTSGSVDLGTTTASTLDVTNTGTQFAVGKNDYKALGYGAKYNLGVATVAAQAGKREYGLTTAANLKETKWSQIGVNVPMGNVELIAVYGKATNYGTDAAEATNVKGHQMGAKYNFSKRTIGYVYTGKSKTETAASADDFKVKTVNVGMMHNF
jgi:general bacterial porin, GBP family